MATGAVPQHRLGAAAAAASDSRLQGERVDGRRRDGPVRISRVGLLLLLVLLLLRGVNLPLLVVALETAYRLILRGRVQLMRWLLQLMMRRNMMPMMISH